jgi:hypothetical protein
VTSPPLQPTPVRSTSQRLRVPSEIGDTTIVEGVRVPDRNRLPLLIGGAVLLVVVIVVIIFATRGGDEKVVTPPPVDDAAEAMAVDAAVVEVPVDAAEPAVILDAPIGDQPDEIDMPGEGSGSGSAKRDRPPPKPNAVELTKQGLNAMVRGDSKTALQLYKQAQRANPSYAPAWRQAGLLHEKMGDRGAAKAAFQRYLILAPNASDAASIRARIGAL